jgi:hypothetical protein
MSPVATIVTLPAWDRAEIACELSGPDVMLPAEVIVTSPVVCALMPMELAPSTDTLPNELIVIGA